MSRTTGPRNLDSTLYRLLRDDKVDEFNRTRPDGEIDLKDGNFRGCDLRGANLADVDFRGAYFRNADLRGLDLTTANMEHASIAQALVSGCLFPQGLAATELRLSLEHGTRMRYT